MKKNTKVGTVVVDKVNEKIEYQRGKKLYPGFLISINGSLFFEITK